MPSRNRALQAFLRNDLRAFTQKAFYSLTPGEEFIDSFYIDAIAWALERVRLGELKRLIINLPPRSLKSTMASVAFPAFVLGHDPTKRIIAVSYSGDLAKKFSNDFRALINEEWYRPLFPSTRVGSFKNTETEIELTKRGYRLATSVTGTLTGRGGDIIIIDDPLKPDDAFSESRREAVNEWFKTTLISRLDDKRKGAIIVVMQRVHMHDLTGFLTESSDEWEVLSLPAIATSDQTVAVWGGASHVRKRGEALSPRDAIETLDLLKLQLGSEAFSAQYQQQPMPAGGARVKREWFRNRYKEPPEPSQVRMVLQSWDTATKGGPDNDYSVCTTWFVTRHDQWFLMDVWRRRVSYPDLRMQVQRLAEQWGARRILVEDAGIGPALVQELHGKLPGIVEVRPDMDKEARMSVASRKMEWGLVYLPESAPWLHELEVELFSFPAGRHDDQCDSISQALRDENKSFMTLLSSREMQELLERSRKVPRTTAVFL